MRGRRATARAAWTSALLAALVLPVAADELEVLEIEDLLNAQTSVASRKARSLRESPGVLTIVTRDEIQSSGVRDLIDLLRLVPGFAMGHDVEGVVGMAFRGNWGYEGKILLMVDGIEQNELLYSTVQLGHHYPVDNLERVEIIRGPGSAIYGGSAELAVVNLVTQGPAELDGFAGSVRAGMVDGSAGNQDVTLSYGKVLDAEHDGAFSISTFVGHGQRSTLPYTDFEGNVYSMDGNSDLDPLFVNLFGSYGGFRARLLHDDYRMTERDSFGTNIPRPAEMDFVGTFLELSYRWELSERLELVPSLTFRRHTPWRVEDKSLDDFYTKTADRAAATLLLAYDDHERLSFNAGVQTYRDHAKVNSTELIGSQTLFGDDDEVDYSNVALFSEGMWSGGLGTLLLGARYDHHSDVEDSFVPRIAYTKLFGDFHLKALYSEAFRAPGIENLNLSDPGNPIRPESTRVFELEGGWQAGKHAFLSANVFDVTIEDPIVYFFDAETESENYVNFSETGTRGFEAGASLRYGWGFVNASYSYYTAAGKNEVTLYEVPGSDDELLGMPRHKVAVSTRLTVWKGLSVNPSLVWLGDRHAYVAADEEGLPVMAELDATLLANLLVEYRGVGVEGLDLALGAYNLTDEEHEFIQPYDGGKPPLPGPRREIFLRLTARF